MASLESVTPDEAAAAAAAAAALFPPPAAAAADATADADPPDDAAAAAAAAAAPSPAMHLMQSERNSLFCHCCWHCWAKHCDTAHIRKQSRAPLRLWHSESPCDPLAAAAAAAAAAVAPLPVTAHTYI